MTIPFYQVDAFTTEPFSGNPAAVSPLTAWLDDAIMQKIAMENNLSETAFFVPKGEDYDIRWFTPAKEVKLCGHATLASAYILFEKLGHQKEQITFHSKSGPLHVGRKGIEITMDFPTEPAMTCSTPQAIVDAFGLRPVEVLKSVDYIVVFDESVDITTLTPDLDALRTLDLRGVCITTSHKEYDFVNRFFAPNYGIDEDSVTGSAYTQLAPYWSKKLGKNSFRCRQVSPRGGEVNCTLKGDRLLISGSAVCTIEGEMHF